MSVTLNTAFRSFLVWLLGTWLLGSVLWTVWVMSAGFPWNPRDSPLAQIGGTLVVTLLLSLPMAITGSAAMTLFREAMRRALPPGAFTVAALLLSMALGYWGVALAWPEHTFLHVVGLMAAGGGELLVFWASRVGSPGRVR